MQNTPLTRKEVMMFPLGSSMGIDKNKKWSLDFWKFFKDADEKFVGSDLCVPYKIIGTKKTSKGCKGIDSYCFKLLYDEVDQAKAYGVAGMYDASRGTFDLAGSTVVFPSEDKEKCCLIAQSYYHSFKRRNITPAAVGLSHRHASLDYEYNQLFVGYDMSDAGNHPYGAQKPYTNKTHKNTGLKMLDSTYNGFNHEVFAHTYIKKIETLKTKVLFDEFDKFYTSNFHTHTQERLIITVTKTKVTIKVDSKSPGGKKHELNIRTCKTCAKNATPDMVNSTSPTDDLIHERQEGTLEFTGTSRDADEGGCQDCVEKLTSWYNAKHGGNFEASDLITTAG